MAGPRMTEELQELNLNVGHSHYYDNSMVETLFKSIKAELIWRNRWDTRRQAEGAIFQFYDPRRRHSSLGGKSPLAFERKAA